jgi:hypothetical protein
MVLSGPSWVSLYPTSKSINTLDPSFRSNVQAFLDALIEAKASVQITATTRPRERAYLMHYSWCIWRHWNRINPAAIPAFVPRGSESRIDIEWLHKTPTGLPDLAATYNAAQAMVRGYGIGRLRVPPALTSNHIAGKAIDMIISWKGDLSIKEKSGTTKRVASMPRDGTNAELITVGKTYDVYHLVNVAADPPHWSYNGH